MQFTPTPLNGAFIIEAERIEDKRGFFARSFCQHEFAAHGLASTIAQCNISFNKLRGTLRGMHYQLTPHAEAKLVSCTSGAIQDVIIDLRPNSATIGQWFGYELNARQRNALYIPEGFAHGFQTLEENSEVFYQMFNFFSPDNARGIRWNDPHFNIKWPLPVTQISERDSRYADYTGAAV